MCEQLNLRWRKATGKSSDGEKENSHSKENKRDSVPKPLPCVSHAHAPGSQDPQPGPLHPHPHTQLPCPAGLQKSPSSLLWVDFAAIPGMLQWEGSKATGSQGPLGVPFQEPASRKELGSSWLWLPQGPLEDKNKHALILRIFCGIMKIVCCKMHPDVSQGRVDWNNSSESNQQRSAGQAGEETSRMPGQGMRREPEAPGCSTGHNCVNQLQKEFMDQHRLFFKRLIFSQLGAGLQETKTKRAI